MANERDCEAYGLEAREFAALCFVADLGQRQRLFRRVHGFAASGDGEPPL